MAFTRWGCTFDGPWPNTDLLKPRPGIWVIWSQTDTQWTVIDVGESKNVRKSVLRLAPSYLAQGSGSLHYSAAYTSQQTDAIRKELWKRIHRLACPLNDQNGG